MKRSLLALTLLLSAPVFAATLEEAQNRVGQAQAAHKAELERLEQIKAEMNSAHAATQEGVGQKHASVMEDQQAKFRGKTDAYNQCVQRCQDLQNRVHQTVAEVGKEHTVSCNGGVYTVSEAPKGSTEPIVQRTTATNAPYSNGGKYRYA